MTGQHSKHMHGQEHAQDSKIGSRAMFSAFQFNKLYRFIITIIVIINSLFNCNIKIVKNYNSKLILEKKRKYMFTNIVIKTKDRN